MPKCRHSYLLTELPAGASCSYMGFLIMRLLAFSNVTVTEGDSRGLVSLVVPQAGALVPPVSGTSRTGWLIRRAGG